MPPQTVFSQRGNLTILRDFRRIHRIGGKIRSIRGLDPCRRRERQTWHRQRLPRARLSFNPLQSLGHTGRFEW